jgi:hypothetical protein
MPALYPSMVGSEAFKVGDCVKKFVTEWNVTPYTGVVTQLAPVACKVWVQWPIAHTSEDPETLIKVNPLISGMPTALVDRGYSSYEKTLSDQANGSLPKRVTPSRDLKQVLIPKMATETNKMAIRIAHTFAANVVVKLVDRIGECQESGLTDIQAYNNIFKDYGDICSDYIIKSSIQRVYAGEES